jgi:hypothetical protein
MPQVAHEFGNHLRFPNLHISLKPTSAENTIVRGQFTIDQMLGERCLKEQGWYYR